MGAADKLVGIVGFGHVGMLTKDLFPDAVVYDKHLTEFSSPSARSAVSSADVCFVCVPTPRSAAGSADVEQVLDVCSWIGSGLVVIRSTVPPGTTALIRERYGLRAVCWPEYIGHWAYPTGTGRTIRDWPAVVVGGEVADTAELVEVLAERLGPEKTYRQAPAAQVEMAKYMENAWLAVQVAFAREFRTLADALGVDYWELRELWALDPRVVKTHTAALRGKGTFGGRCLPKDLAAIVATAAEAELAVPLLTATLSYAEFTEDAG